MAQFEIEARSEGSTEIIAVRGDVDMDSSPRLRDQIQSSLRGCTTLRVDLQGVEYLDSSGIAVLIQGLKWAQKADVPYVLVEPSSQVRQVIDLAQLNQLFTIEPPGDS